MRIDMKRDAEVAKRKGLAGRTTAAVISLVVGFGIAYAVSLWLFKSEHITSNFFYTQLSVPITVSEGILQIFVAIMIVFLLQFIAIIAFALASPSARERPGTPSAVARDPDYYESYSFSD